MVKKDRTLPGRLSLTFQTDERYLDAFEIHVYALKADAH